MAHLLRLLLLASTGFILVVLLAAKGIIHLNSSHIVLAIPAFLCLIFIQAFVMFYFIGVARLAGNVHATLVGGQNLEKLFDQVPKDLGPYMKKVDQFVYDSTLGKRKTIPWTMLMLLLGSLGFLMGGAYDTGLVSRVTHVGIIYGFIASMLLGFIKQWTYLGRNHRLLRQLKALFGLPDHQM